MGDRRTFLCTSFACLVTKDKIAVGHHGRHSNLHKNVLAILPLLHNEVPSKSSSLGCLLLYSIITLNSSLYTPKHRDIHDSVIYNAVYARSGGLVLDP